MAEEAFLKMSPKREIDHGKLDALLVKMRDEQSIVLAVVAGLVASCISAVIWAGITAATNFQIGWMAVGVGFFVGVAVRALGKGTTKTFGVVGAFWALFGCLLGNFLNVCVFISMTKHIPLMDLLSRFDAKNVVDIMVVTFQPMDIVFYAIAVYEGYRFSFRRISDEEIRSVMVESSEAV